MMVGPAWPSRRGVLLAALTVGVVLGQPEPAATSERDPAASAFVHQGRVLFQTEPMPGDCLIVEGGSLANRLRESLLALAAAAGTIAGAAVDCAWLDEVERGVRAPDPFPISYAVTLLQATDGEPWRPEQARPKFLAILAAIYAGESGQDIIEHAEGQARAVGDQWLDRLGSASGGMASRDVLDLGPVARDENGLYSATIRDFSDGQDRRLLATVSAATLINGIAVAAKASTFIEDAEDLRPVIEASQRYARHLIELNEGGADRGP